MLSDDHDRANHVFQAILNCGPNKYEVLMMFSPHAQIIRGGGGGGEAREEPQLPKVLFRCEYVYIRLLDSIVTLDVSLPLYQRASLLL